MGNIRKKETQNLVFAAIFTALIAVFAQIPPTTHEFPITLQTFAIALCGYTLSVRYSLLSIVSYVLLGLVGAPVFSGFCGGYHHLIGPAGGFIIAFPILVLFCALSQKLKPVIFKILFGVCGMVLTYVLGVIYF
jgi:biotin transport system substrate-specific component